MPSQTQLLDLIRPVLLDTKSSDYFAMDMEDYAVTCPGIGKMESFISSGDTLCDVVKAGYLKKVRTNKKKYFILRRTSALGPARLEYYDSEKRFSKPGAVPKRIIKVRDCWNISNKKDARQKQVILIYTKEDSLALIAEENEHENWFNELRDLHEIELSKDPSAQKYEHMWNITMKPTGLGSQKNFLGKYRLCLSPTHLSLIRLDMDVADLSLPLSTIRRCGHNQSHFVLVVGRSAPTGEGELAMQVDDSATSQNMHGVILDAMKSNKNTEQSNYRTRTRSHQNKPSGYRSSLPAVDMAPMARPRTMSESTKIGPHSTVASHRHSPKTLDRRTMSALGRTSAIGSSTASSPFSSCSSIDHGFRIRSDSSGSRATTTSGEDSTSHHSSEHPVDEVDYLDMTCGGAGSETGRASGGEDDSYMVMDPSGDRSALSSRHSCHSLENHTEDSGYIEMSSGGSIASKPDGANLSRRPSLISPPDEDSPSPAAFHSDYVPYSPAASPDHPTPIAESEPTADYVMHDPATTTSRSTSTSAADEHHTPHHTESSSSSSLSSSSAVHIPPPLIESDYMPMGPCHSLPTVQERSGENRIIMEPNASLGFGIIFPPQNDVAAVTGVNQQQQEEDFPKRAYSVGSRPESKRPKTKAKLSDTQNKNDAKSSSAPHLTVAQQILNSPASSRGSASPALARSNKGSREDSELFMEVSFDRPRCGSDAYRPRTSSWGQAHRPRANSHTSKLKRSEQSSFQTNHQRSNSQDINKRDNNTRRRSLPGSSESLTKIHYVSPCNHDYMEISSLASDSEKAAKEIQKLAQSVNEMTMQYTEITGPVGIVSRHSQVTSTYPNRTRYTVGSNQQHHHYHYSHHYSVTARPPSSSSSSSSSRPIKLDEDDSRDDTYVVSEPLNVRNGGDVIPRMVDVTPPLEPGEEDDDDDYMCFNMDS